MKKIRSSFVWLSVCDNEYQIEGFIHPGQPAPPQDGARFQEPDDPDTFEFVSATMLLGGCVFGESDFSEAELSDIAIAAFDNAEIETYDAGE